MTQNLKEESETSTNTKFKDGVNRNARLIVRNIPFKATEESLREHFSRFGTVEEVKLLKKPDGKLVGCGFVHFTHVPMANEAILATNKKPFLDRPIYVAWAVPKFKYGEKEQQEDPKRHIKKDSQKEKAVEIKDEDTVETEAEKQKNKPRINRNARLIIRNISFKATEETLKEHFQPYGEIIEVKLLKKPDGKLVGCAFVHFKNVPMAKKALLSTNMKAFLGRPISVDWAVAKNKYMQHIVTQQMEMEDEVKKEDSESDDDGPPLNISHDDLKQEVKSESDEDSEDDDDDKPSVKSESDGDTEGSDDSGDDNDEDDDDEDDEDDEQEDDVQSEASTQGEWKRTKLNDSEDGLTVFVSNLPFSVDDAQLRQFAQLTAPVAYALVCVDKLTEHSKGSGFIKFTKKEDAEKFLALPADQLKLEGQVIYVKPALNRENLQQASKKQPKDNRNLYLVKEGVIVAGTKAAAGVTASDMAKRLALERSKTQMLKNLNRFVSRYRLVVSNLPGACDDARLRRVCVAAADPRADVTECRVMRDLRAPTGQDGKQPSKGYGFVMFTRHEDALSCLRKLNNNPDIFDKNNRPIVSFSIEDRTALNARKKRLEKSIANNPLSHKTTNNADNEAYSNRKRKNQSQPDESHFKKQRLDNQQDRNQNKWENQNNQGRQGGKKWEDNRNQGRNAGNNWKDRNQNGNVGNNWKDRNQNRNGGNKWEERKNQGRNAGKKWGNKNNQDESIGRFVRFPQSDNVDEYTGLTAKEGSQHKMRTNQKLRTQADLHRQNVKQEKKVSKNAMRLKKAARERVKQPKQKINKNPAKNKRKKFKPNNIKDILK